MRFRRTNTILNSLATVICHQKTTFFIVLGASIYLYVPAYSHAEALSIDQAVGEAESNSPEIHRSQAQSSQAEWGRVEQMSGFLPKLNLTADHMFAEQYQFANVVVGGDPFSIPLLFPVTDFAVNASITVFDGFANVNNYKSAALLQDAAHLDLDWSRFSLQERVRIAYYSALAAIKLDEVAQQNIKTLQDHIEKIRVRKSGGLATNYDVLRVDVQLSEAQSEKMLADDNVILERKKLNQLLGLRSDDRQLEGELPVPVSAQIEAALSKLSEPTEIQRPDLAAVQKREEAADRANAAAAAFLIPKVSVAGQYEWYNNIDDRIVESDPYRAAYQVGVFVTWNVFDGAASIAKSKQSAAAYEIAQANRQSDDLKVPYDYEFWKRRYRYSSVLFEAKSQDIKKSEESVRLANEGYKAGTRTVSEQLDAELDLFRARAGAVNAQLSAAQSLINLELTLGKKVAYGNN